MLGAGGADGAGWAAAGDCVATGAAGAAAGACIGFDLRVVVSLLDDAGSVSGCVGSCGGVALSSTGSDPGTGLPLGLRDGPVC